MGASVHVLVPQWMFLSVGNAMFNAFSCSTVKFQWDHVINHHGEADFVFTKNTFYQTMIAILFVFLDEIMVSPLEVAPSKLALSLWKPVQDVLHLVISFPLQATATDWTWIPQIFLRPVALLA